MTVPNDCPHSDEQWSREIADLLQQSDSSALARRDRLVRCDKTKTASLLSMFLADDRADALSRTKAAWLLKDLSDPTVAPTLQHVACSAECPEQLREQIFDTLERLSFGDPHLEMDLDRLSTVIRDPGSRRHFISLLLNIGNDKAQRLLSSMLTREPDRAEALALLGEAPGTWIDGFLDKAIPALDSDGQIAGTIAARRHRELQRDLKALPEGARVGPEVIQRLWRQGDVSLIAWLATHQHLDEGAIREVQNLDSAGLSNSQRKLLTRSQNYLKDA